jgi:2-dehydro-3-deoxygluconokinase
VQTAALLWKVLKRSRLVALLAPESAEQCVAAYELFSPLGVVLEIALRTEAALDGLAAVRARYPDALCLAGTVLTRRQAEQAIEAGAAGIVCPDFVPAVVEACVQKNVMCVPGGTADVGKQLALKAELYGCEPGELRARYPYQWVYKLFPALTPAANLDLVAAWRAVYPGLAIMYTGGVNAENLHHVIERDPEAIICGSALARDVHDAERTRREVERWQAALRPPAERPHAAAARSAGAGPSGTTPRVVTFGEVLLRLSPPPRLRLTQARSLGVAFGGAEANVAASLANWGLSAQVVTALPEHAVGQAALSALRAAGIDTQHVLRQGARLGVYYLEPGASQRPSQVIYDRAGSAMTTLRPEQVDWQVVLRGASWFHCSGITPALSPVLADMLRAALEAAHRAGVTVSLDLNYRAKLWSAKQARETLTPLMDYVNVLIGNEEDAGIVFGIGPGAVEVARGRLEPEAYREVTRQLVQRFRLWMAAVTLRESTSASDNTWSAYLHDGHGFHASKRYSIHVVDRVGAGDAFAAGLIYGLLSGRSEAEALEFAVAASCWKHTVSGDFNAATVAELDALAAGDTSGRVRR